MRLLLKIIVIVAAGRYILKALKSVRIAGNLIVPNWNLENPNRDGSCCLRDFLPQLRDSILAESLNKMSG
jgi:hypothetical protein